MFDNLREMSDDSSLFQEVPEEAPAPKRKKRRSGKKFLGMTPGQRFLLALLLFFAVLMLGAMCLLVTEKVMLV